MRLILVLLSTTALSACSSLGPLAPFNSGDSVSASRGALPDAPAYWAQIGEDVGPVQVGWVQAFGDPVLAALIEEGLANNNSLVAAEANVARSWALAKQAGAALTPNVGLTAGGGGTGIADGGSTGDINVGLQASWELDVWGRIRSGRSAAVSSAQAAEADYSFAQQSVAAAIARSYFLSIEANQQTDVAKGILDALERTKRIVDVQFENGLATAQDVALVKSDLATAEDAVATAEGGQRDATRALELLLGRFPGAELDVGAQLPAAPAPPPAGLPSEILERRPDLVAAERRIAAAISSVNQAKAARLPSISLTGGVGGSSDDLSNLLNPSNIAWQAASSLLVPIIDGNSLEAQVEVTSADQKAAVAAYADAALQAFAEVESSLDQGEVLRDRQRALDAAKTESEEALRLAQLRFNAGESDLLDVLAIQQRVFTAQRNALSVQRLQLDQYVDLNLALGGDWRAAEIGG